MLVPLASIPPRKLAALEAAVFDASAAYDSAPWTEEHFGVPLPEKEQLSAVYVVDSLPVGFAVASRRADGSVRLHRLAVHPKHAGRRIGSTLLAWLLEQTTAELSVTCEPANARALALYRSFGFADDGVTDDGKLLLRLTARDVRCWYVFNASSITTGHASHIPRLLESLTGHVAVEGVAYGSASFPRARGDLASLLAICRAVRRARRERVRVVYVRIHWLLAAVFGLAGRALGWRTLLWSSGGSGHLDHDARTRRDLVRSRMFDMVLRHFIDGLVTGPPTVASEYEDRYGIPARKVLLGANDVDVERWAASASSDEASIDGWLASEHRLLYVHGVDELRGADRLPTILDAVQRYAPDAALLVVGRSSLRHPLPERDDLVLTGPLPNATIPALLARADVLLVPSRQEGFPRVVLEALACGCPPVCMDVGGCRDVVGHDLEEELVADSLDGFAALAARWCKRKATTGERAAFVERAREFDTQVVARRLGTMLGLAGTSGVAAARRYSWATWQETYLMGRR